MLKTILLLAGAAAPVIYFGLVAAAGLLFPGFDYQRQYLSELSMAEAPHAEVFNYALFAAGGLMIAGGAGLFAAFRERGGGWLPSALAAVSVVVFGASLIIGGLFPLPDERHMGWGAAFAAQVAPLFCLWALWPARGHAGLKALLAVAFLAANALLAVMFGVGELVSQDNVGIWQRAYAASVFPWITIACLALLGRPASRESGLGRRTAGALT